MFSKELRIEIYPVEFKLCRDTEDADSEENYVTHSFSRNATIGTLYLVYFWFGLLQALFLTRHIYYSRII